jgi:hypothetical protein
MLRSGEKFGDHDKTESLLLSLEMFFVQAAN